MYQTFTRNTAAAGLLALGTLAACSTSEQEGTTTIKSEAMPAARLDTAAAAPLPQSAPAAPRPTDSAQVSAAFVRGLRALPGSKQYKVRGKWLVLNAKDSVAFPTELPLGQPVSYTAHRGREQFCLTVTRLTYTSLRFRAETTGGKASPTPAEGVAELNPSFYQTPELPETAESKPAFSAAEFAAETAQGHFSILIGQGRDADKAGLSAYDATGSPRPQWENVPTLRRTAL